MFVWVKILYSTAQNFAENLMEEPQINQKVKKIPDWGPVRWRCGLWIVESVQRAQRNLLNYTSRFKFNARLLNENIAPATDAS